MKNIICIIGKTGRGKDTLARRIHKEMGIPIICSYTTRAIRNNETDGVEHHFITNEEMDTLIKEKEIIAYTEIAGNRYCATVIDDDYEEFIYIIDPKGFYSLKENFGSKYNIFAIELWASDYVIEDRIKKRGDDWNTYLERSNKEREDFDNFHNNYKYDISISAEQPQDKIFSDFYRYYMREYNI